MNYTGKEYASNGKGNLGVTLGAVGTGLALMGNNNGCNNGGLFGNLFGNNCNSNCYVTEKESNLSTALAIAQSEKYTSEKSEANLKELYAETLRLNTIQRETDAKIADGLIQTGNALGLLNSDVACLKQEVARNREEAKNYTDTRVNSEAQLRQCEDEKVVLWTKSQNYVQGSNKIDPDQICGPSPISSGCCY